MISRNGILPKVRGTWDEMPESKMKYGDITEFSRKIQELPKENGTLPLWRLISYVSVKMSKIYKKVGDEETAENLKSFAAFSNETRNNAAIFKKFLSYRKQDAFLELESDVKQALNADGSSKDIIWQNIYNQLTGVIGLLNEDDKNFLIL